MQKTIHTDHAPKAIGPYAQAVQANGFLFTSGQLGIDPATGLLAEGVENQAHAAMRNLGAILEAAGCGFGKVVKTTIFLADLNDFSAVNAIYESYFDASFPARSCFQVAQLPKNGLIEIECIAAME